MPKPQVSSKARSTDATGASANAKDGPANPPAIPEKPPDNEYAMCKELCQQMSDSILRVINERFNVFHTSLQTLVTTQADFQARIANQELATNDLEARMQGLEATCSELANQNKQLQTKVLDLEARSRRHNIKIVGIPEGEEGGKPTEFVSQLIPKLLREGNFPHPVKVDRAHRSLQLKPPADHAPSWHASIISR